MSNTFHEQSLSQEPNIFRTIDVESKSLHGEAFIVAGLTLHTSGELRDVFVARVEVREEDLDPWTIEHVLPACRSIHVTHRSARAMRDAFWEWIVASKSPVVADCPVPVEANLLDQCVMDNPSRAFKGPYPLYDVASFISATGFNDRVNRAEYVGIHPEYRGVDHDPRWDALVSGLAQLKALRNLGLVSDGRPDKFMTRGHPSWLKILPDRE